MPLPRPLAPLLAPALATIGLAVSTASLVDSLGPAPAYCAAGGCATVRASAWAHPLGVPLPALGIAFFAAALVLAALGPRARTARRVVAAVGGAGAAALIALQGLVIGAWCKLCLVTDTAAILHAVAVLAAGATWTLPTRGRSGALAGIAVVALGAPFAGLRTHAPRPPAVSGLPDAVAREQVPGQVVIVDFVDFECPFCRDLHGRLAAAIREAGVPVRVVRKMVPLDQHHGALPAAIAWCSADRQGKGDAMAEALIAAPTAQLTPDGCAKLAASLGLDMARYTADAGDPAVRTRIEADRADAKASGLHVLPTIFINDQAFQGATATQAELVAALRRAAG